MLLIPGVAVSSSAVARQHCHCLSHVSNTGLPTTPGMGRADQSCVKKYSYTDKVGRVTLLCAAFTHNSWNRVSVRRTPAPKQTA